MTPHAFRIFLLAVASAGAALPSSAALPGPALQPPAATAPVEPTTQDGSPVEPPDADEPDPSVPERGSGGSLVPTPTAGDEPEKPSAADDPSRAPAALFHWAAETTGWTRGGIYAGLGLAGALVTMFSLIGGAIPGTAGAARIDAESRRLEIFYSRLTRLADLPAPDAKLLSALNDVADRLRDDLRRERWKLFGLGFVLYVLLGALFAMALAQNYLQALVIGAGWTGYVGTLGLKSDFGERKRIKDESLEEAQRVVQALGRDGHAAASPAESGSAGFELETLVQIEEGIRAARAV